MIWFDAPVQLTDINALGEGNMGEFLGIEFTAIGDDWLQATMPVDRRTRQPYGLLHGGASCVLAETLGSVASSLVIDPNKFLVVGIEINANHVRSAREGKVIGMVKPIHLGASTHVWDIRITDEGNKLICISRLTVAVLPKKDQKA